MKLQSYKDWRDTNITLHMITQMMGKTKLSKMSPEPEWNHSLLFVDSRGFTTGLINDINHSFEVKLNLHDGIVEAICTSGAYDSFELRNNTSVSEYYENYLSILKNIGHPIKIYPVPQEVFFDTPFNQQNNKVDFDKESALNYFKISILIRNALLSFASEYKGKKILPALFWGTFDLTTVLFSGEERPFSGEGIIEKVAFNEQFVEFGYWPGDESGSEPSLFVLAYPFIEKDLSHLTVEPKEAYYSQKQAEYFLRLEDILKYDNPEEIIKDFCKTTFLAIAKEEKWENTDWLLEPFNINKFK